MADIDVLYLQGLANSEKAAFCRLWATRFDLIGKTIPVGNYHRPLHTITEDDVTTWTREQVEEAARRVQDMKAKAT